MTDDRLRRVNLERVVSREDRVLRAAWIQRPVAATGYPTSEVVHRGSAPPTALCGDGAVLVCLGPDPADALAALIANARAGARVYALVDATSPTIDARLLAGTRVLLRRVPELLHASVQTPTAARLWIGSGWSLALDDRQRASLRHLFLRAFWHDATEESVLQGDAIEWRRPMARPEEVPEPDATQALSRLAPGAPLVPRPSSTRLLLRAGTAPASAPAELFVPPDGAQHDALTRLTRAGVSVRWNGLDLPDLELAPDGGALLLRGAKGDLRVRLNQTQCDVLDAILSGPGAWRFACDARIGDPSLRDASFWLPGEPGPRPLDREAVLRLGDVRGSALDDYHLAEPEVFPEGPVLALAVRHTWTALPPSVPKGASEDALIGRWRALDTRWAARRDALVASLEALLPARERLAQFPGQDGAVLGFARAHADLAARVSALPAALGGADSASAHEAIASLESLDASYDTLASALAKAEHAAKMAQAREAQEQAWRDRRDAARMALSPRRQAFEESTARVATLRNALDSRKEDGEISRSDREARRRRDADALQRAERDARRLGDEVQALERAAHAEFHFEAPPPSTASTSRKGAAFVPTPARATEALEVPEEALPEVGALRTHKGRRYLVIERRAELDAARMVADRLRAELVAPEDA